MNVTGISTFGSNVDLNADLDVDGRTELDITNISETLNVVGIATFANNIDANGDLDVDGRTELDITNIAETLSVVGISTFTGNIDANGDLDVDGTTELDVLNVAETATFSSNIDANGDLDVDGRTELDVTNISETLNVVGVSTFTGNIDANGDLDVDGRTELDVTNISETLNVVGISTFTGNIDANGDLDVDGRTELDTTNISETLNVVGIATFQSNVHLGDDIQLRLGDDNDLRIYHMNQGQTRISKENGNNLMIRNKVPDQDIIISTDNGTGGGSITPYFRAQGATGEVKLYHYGSEKLATKSTGIDVTGNTETDDLTVTGTAYLNGTVSAGSSTGNDGQYLISTGVGVSWTTIPTARTTTTITATEDQTSFPFTYNVGFLDVFYNGVKLADSEFTASNGTAVVLNDVAYAGDVVELVSYNTAASGGGGGGASNLNDLADVTITGSPIVGETLQHNGTKFVNDFTVTQTTTSTSEVAILGLDVSEYRSVEYNIQVTEGTNYHATKILALHDSTDAFFSEYGTITNNNAVATFNMDVSGSNMRLLATPASSNSTVFKVKFTGIKV